MPVSLGACQVVPGTPRTRSACASTRVHVRALSYSIQQGPGKAAPLQKPTATSELRAVHRRNGRAYQHRRPAIPVQDPAVGGRGHGWTYAELHCAASHGRWRFNRAKNCNMLHGLPTRYLRLIVLLKARGGGQ
jgi:hypothetical protein